MKDLQPILSQYNIGRVDSASRLSGGLINVTYLIETEKGNFVLQKLSPIFKKEVVFDFDAVSRYLENRQLVQRIIRTKTGDLLVEHEGVWRMLNFVPGKVFETTNPPLVYEAGNILGKFHRALEHFDYQFLHKRSNHHTAEALLKKLSTVFVAENNELKEANEVIQEILRLLLPSGLRKNISHGDPKINNIIFQENNADHYTATTLIDLDDCGREHNVLIELGDAFRSWCGEREDSENNQFDLEKFEMALRGYDMGSAHFLNEEERQLLPRAIQLITLELAM